MADLKYTSRDKRGRWQYRRHIPEKLRHRFGTAEFIRALPDDDAERALQYAIVAAEFEATANGEAARSLVGIVPRANNPNAPPPSAEAKQHNRALAETAQKLLAARAENDEPEEAPEPDDPPTVAEAVQRFLSDPLRASTDQTKGQHAPRLETLSALLGPNALIAGITKAEARTAVELLHQLPREYRRSSYAALTPREAIERGKADNADTLSPKTRGHYIATWRSFFAWAAEEDIVVSSPIKTLKAPKVKQNKDRQDAWTTAALNVLFDTPLYRLPEERIARPGEFWLPIIALHQGMRQAEIVLLAKADLRKVQGIWCFDIRERPGRTLKNESSARVVPVHDALIALGLVDYVRALPEGPMWPGLLVGKKGKPLADPPRTYGKAFDGQVKAAKLKVKGRDFHALRHEFTTACRAARVPDSCRLYLGGWVQKEGVAGGYGRHDIAALKSELERVAHPGVKLPAR